jgi:putative endonuclease
VTPSFFEEGGVVFLGIHLVMSSYTVYVLQSIASGRLYIGQTNDLARRLREHRSGQTRSTRGRGPWEVIYWRTFPTRSEAVCYECELRVKGEQ